MAEGVAGSRQRAGQKRASLAKALVAGVFSRIVRAFAANADSISAITRLITIVYDRFTALVPTAVSQNPVPDRPPRPGGPAFFQIPGFR